ncbi:MAG: zf-HC2 domain-containing protein [candidate division WOR-3 bacterium]|nr:MAG: zf-HC2 domain-containing protein [candidate division WOR-3 bacterium]
MKHKEIERLIQKGLDGELKPNDKARLDNHLARCHDCATFHQEMSQTTRLVRQLGEIHPRADFNARILARLGIRQRFAWTKAGIVFAGSWVAVLLLFTYSSLPTRILGWLTTSFPSIVRVSEKAELVITSLSQVLTPILKSSLSNANPVIGLVFSILFIYFLGKALQKEVKCKA